MTEPASPWRDAFPSPHRYDLGPVWEGSGWIVRASSGAFSVQVQANADMPGLGEAALAAFCQSASGMGSRARVEMRILADNRNDCWILLDFFRQLILNEFLLSGVVELSSPRSIAEMDPNLRCAATKFMAMEAM